jgi:hypothetical protein
MTNPTKEIRTVMNKIAPDNFDVLAEDLVIVVIKDWEFCNKILIEQMVRLMKRSKEKTKPLFVMLVKKIKQTSGDNYITFKKKLMNQIQTEFNAYLSNP